MRNLFKKSLACCLAIALCLTAMVGLTVSAAEVAGTITVGEVTVEPGTATANVDITLSAAGLSEAILNVSTDAGTITAVTSNDVTATLATNGIKMALFTEGDSSVDSATATITVALADTETEKEYAVNVSIATAASVDENLITAEPAAGKISVKAAEPVGPVEDNDIQAALHSVSMGDTFGIGFRYKLSSLKEEYKSFSLEINRKSADSKFNFIDAETVTYENASLRAVTAQDLLLSTVTYFGVELYSTTAPIEYTLHCFNADGEEVAYCTKTTTLADVAIAYHDSTSNVAVKKALADLIQVGAAALNHFTANRTKVCDYSSLPVPTIESEYITTELGALNAVSSGEGIAITLAAGVNTNPYFTMRFTENIANKEQYHYEISYYNALTKETVTNTVDSTTMTGNATTIFTSFRAVPMYASNADVTFKLYKEGTTDPVSTYHYSLEAYYNSTLETSSNATLKTLIQELGELAQSFRTMKKI